MIPNKYPHPLISKLLDKTRGENWFTSLHLTNVYNLIRIAAGDKWKTAFCIQPGHFAHTVKRFSLTNAPVSFPEMIDAIFKDMEKCISYLNDILICGDNTKAELLAMVEIVLQQCVKHGLTVNLLNSEFHVKRSIFLLHVTNGQEGKMDLSKPKSWSKWLIPTKK